MASAINLSCRIPPMIQRAFVPIIGSIVGAIPPLILAFADNPLDALWVLLAYVPIQQIESNLLTPLVMQRTVSLHPVVVIATVTVASAAFGILGTLLAVPASVVASVFVERLWFRRLEEKIQILPDKTGSFARPAHISLPQARSAVFPNVSLPLRSAGRTPTLAAGNAPQAWQGCSPCGSSLSSELCLVSALSPHCPGPLLVPARPLSL